MIPQSQPLAQTLAQPLAQPPVILLTRPLAQSQVFAERITQAFGPQEIVISPVMAIRALGAGAPSGGFSDLLFTSQQAPGMARALGFALPDHAYCVGERTAQAARQAGFSAAALGGDAAGLVAALIAAPPAGRLLHLHGVETRGAVADRLCAAGIPTVALAIYDQPPLPLTHQARQALNGDRPVILPIFSPRTARILVDQGPFGAKIMVVAISPAVADAARDLSPHRPEIAQSPDAGGMLDALGGILRHPRT